MCGGARVAAVCLREADITDPSPQSPRGHLELLGPEMTIFFTKNKMLSDTQDLLCAHFLAHLHVLLMRKLKAERAENEQRGSCKGDGFSGVV